MVTNLWLLRLIVGVAADLAKRWGRSMWNVETAHDGFAGPFACQSELAILKCSTVSNYSIPIE